MAVTIDWGTKIISITQSYLNFVSGTTYQLDCDTFRLSLKSLEDDLTGGMPYLDTHNHISPVTLSGSTYARFVEIINDYTITFEDGLYQVNLSGANNNIVDVLNRNSVSVVANNSSGLIASDQLEYSSFQNQITIDTARGTSGTSFPIGTVGSPVNNIADALLIAEGVGISRLLFKNSYTFASGIDVSGYELIGDSPAKATLTFESGSIGNGIELFDCTFGGYMGAVAGVTGCHMDGVIGTAIGTGTLNIHDSIIEGDLTMGPGMSGEIQFFNCKSGVAGQATPTFNINGSDMNIIFRDYTGGIKFENLTTGNTSSLDFLSGQVIFDSTCTNANVTVRGICKITNNASGNPNFNLTDETTVSSEDIDLIASAVWDKLVASHETDGTFGYKVGKKLLTTGKFIALK